PGAARVKGRPRAVPRSCPLAGFGLIHVATTLGPTIGWILPVSALRLVASAFHSHGTRTCMRSEVAPRRRTAGAVVLIVVLAVVGALTFLVRNHGRGEGWWGTSDSLQARLDDPLAATDLLGMRLLDSDRTGHVGLFEKAETPFVSHWFTPPSQ